MTFSSLRSKSPLIAVLMGLGLAVPSAFSQTLTITGGQGQLITTGQPTSQPLKVQLLSPTGQPIPGAPITFTSLDTLGGYVPAYLQNVFTDANGNATSGYVGAQLIPGTSQAFDQGTVNATYQGFSTVTFFETTTNVSTSGTPLITPNFTFLSGSQTFSGAAGSVSSTPVQVQLTSNQAVQTFTGVSAAVPNVSLAIVVDPSSTGTISCKEGPIVLTDQNGIATCTPVYGTVGTGFFTFTLGGSVNSNIPIPFTVTVGPPALITMNSGNGQSGTPGKQLPLPIVATVTDLGGNPTPGVAMNFTASPTNGATFTSVRSVTDAAGKVSATVILGSVPGTIQLTVADSGGLIKNPAVFTETVNVTITGITKSTGDNQSAFTFASFQTPLTVNVSSSQGVLSGTPVTFAVTSGSATVATPNATTDGNGNASTTVIAGNTPGPVVVTASTAQFSVSFNLTVTPPGPSNLSFTNGASGATNSLSPGSIVTIYGTGIASNIQGVTSAFGVGPLPTSMVGVTVQFGQVPAPIIDVGNVSGGQQFVSVEGTLEATPVPTTVTVLIAGGGSTTVPVTINQASPGLFTYAGANNQQYLVAIRPNGTVASPSNPAMRGETVTMYLTGLPLTPGIATNAFPAANSTASPAYPVILGVANQGAAFSSVAYSPDLQGVETMSFTVPSNATPGAVQISIGVQAPNGVQYSQGATLNVQ
jgi:uncharacterized protein (TIGR03437 family)